MSPKFWMISNRNVTKSGLGAELASRTYWVADHGPLDDFANWRRLRNGLECQRELLLATDAFPDIEDPSRNEEQKHVTLFIHGYNTPWDGAARRYEKLSRDLYEGESGLGIPVLFSWPSDGAPSNYLPDRADARQAAEDLATVLMAFYDQLLAMQKAAAGKSGKPCKAKVSMIAHSMGNYLVQKAMPIAWTRANQPLLVSLVNQLLMVAADVDNDLFGSGERQEGRDGDAIANLAYRVTCLYSGRDSVLGMSAGLKHFGKRRLGRSGLDGTPPDNVWAYDCSSLIPPSEKNVHSGYFESEKTLELMRSILKGMDRGVIQKAQTG